MRSTGTHRWAENGPVYSRREATSPPWQDTGGEGKKSLRVREGKKLKRPARLCSQSLNAAAASPHPHPPPPKPFSPPQLRMASAGRGSGPAGGMPVKDEISEADMEIMETPEKEAGRVGSKRVRDSPNAKGSHGFIGVTTAEKKPTLQFHNNVKFLKKAGNGNLVHPNVDGTSKMGGLYLHDIHGSQTLPDSNALRFSSSSPGGDLENKTRKPTTICTFYARGRCKKGKSCTFLHEGEGSGSDNRWSKEEKVGVIAPVGYGNHRGSEEGSQAQRLSNLEEPDFENLAGSSKVELYRTLIHAYGEDSRGLTHPVGKHNPTTLKVSQGRFCRIDDSWTTKSTTPVNELGQIPVVQEKNHEPHFMGRHISLPGDSYFDGRGTFPRLHQDGGKLQSNVTMGNIISDSHVSRTYLEPLNPDYRYHPFDSSISLDSLQPNEKLSAYVGTTENLPPKHQKEHSSRRASYSSHSLTGLKNSGHDSSDHSLGSPPLRATSHLGMQSLHQLTPGIEKVGLHKDVDLDKGCSTRTPALLVNSSQQPAAMLSGHFSPIKDEVWITSVPFVPNFPGSTSSQYDRLVDSVDPPIVESINNPKPSNISCSISSQHTDENVIVGGNTDKLLNHNDKSARNMPAKGSNEIAGLIASERGRSSSLDGDNRVKACERKNDAAINNEKTRDFRFHLAEYVKDLVKPIWKEGNLSKDAHKLIVKKSVDKVLASLEPHQVPASEELISNFITASGTKIEKLVKAYVDKHRTR